MNPTTGGWLLFIAAVGMLFSLISPEIRQLDTWSKSTTPDFIGKSIAHLGTIITAFLAGKLMPSKKEKEGDKKE